MCMKNSSAFPSFGLKLTGQNSIICILITFMFFPRCISHKWNCNTLIRLIPQLSSGQSFVMSHSLVIPHLPLCYIPTKCMQCLNLKCFNFFELSTYCMYIFHSVFTSVISLGLSVVEFFFLILKYSWNPLIWQMEFFSPVASCISHLIPADNPV